MNGLLLAEALVNGLVTGSIYALVGAGIALNPVLLAAMSEVGPSESGLASGVVNTAFMMGGALGLAVLASAAAARSEALEAAGAAQAAALHGGYQLAFGCGALFAALAALLSYWLLRGIAPQQPEAQPAT